MIKVFLTIFFFCPKRISSLLIIILFLTAINIKQQKNKNHIKLANNYKILNLHLLETKFFIKRYKKL